MLCGLRVRSCSDMKICEQCGEYFTPRGRQRVCKVCKDGVQETVPKEQEAKAQRPLDRFRTNAVQPGCVGFRHVIR